VPCSIIVWSGQKGDRAPRENPPNGDFSSFRMATFHPATGKYAPLDALRFRLLFVLSLPGGAKDRNAKPRQNQWRIQDLTVGGRGLCQRGWGVGNH